MKKPTLLHRRLDNPTTHLNRTSQRGMRHRNPLHQQGTYAMRPQHIVIEMLAPHLFPILDMQTVEADALKLLQEVDG